MFSSEGKKDSVVFAEETKDFVCNLATRNLREEMNTTSGAYPRGVDEMKEAGGGRQPSCDDTSRMNREVHVRICERLGAKFPGPTRHSLQIVGRRRLLHVRNAPKATVRRQSVGRAMGHKRA